mgnify:CR=1 FL=1
MAKLTQKAVSQVAHLANLKLTPSEIEKLQTELQNIVSYVEELNEVDTSNTLPVSQTTGLEDVWREDLINPLQNLTADEAVSGTEKIHNNSFVVPMVLTQKDS